MTEELEKIVIEKSYLELTLEEKNDLNEWISSEEEFNQMKMMFSGLSIQKSHMERVNPSSNLKERLIAEFENTYSRKRLAWYNKLGLFLWPAEKPWHRKPAFQMVAVACLLVVVLTVVPRISPEKTQMAKQEVSDKENNLIQEKIVEEAKLNDKNNRQQNGNNSQEQIDVPVDLAKDETPLSEGELVFYDADDISQNGFSKAEPLLNQNGYLQSDNAVNSPLRKAERNKLEEKESDLGPLKDKATEDEVTKNYTVAPAAPAANIQTDMEATSLSRSHPDGIYVAESADDNLKGTTNTNSVGQQIEILDLLTAAF